ncbi:MAG: hypothetical protein J2P13_09830 [Acidobacteria bacterium]|nr:hypothetical protein [Acidobacteriota bacterium]
MVSGASQFSSDGKFYCFFNCSRGHKTNQSALMVGVSSGSSSASR